MTDASDVLTDLDRLVDAWLTLPEVAEQLGLPVTRARQLLSERKLAAVRRGPNAALMVPAAFLVADAAADAVADAPGGAGTAVLKGLPGALTLLQDAGYSDQEAIRWLFTPDPTLPGSPVEALRANRGTEVKRRAQALGF
ncbi:MAG: Rv2175c family DNA-binding protein [Frankiaceae bacterium]